MKKQTCIHTALTSALLLLFGWFWIASALFTHLHIIDGKLTAHSHPFTSSGHSHSSAEFFSLQQFSSFENSSDNSDIAGDFFEFSLNLKFCYVQQHIDSFVGHCSSLRAPPVISFI